MPNLMMIEFGFYICIIALHFEDYNLVVTSQYGGFSFFISIPFLW